MEVEFILLLINYATLEVERIYHTVNNNILLSSFEKRFSRGPPAL